MSSDEHSSAPPLSTAGRNAVCGCPPRVLVRAARVLTLSGDASAGVPDLGADLGGDLGTLACADVLLENGRISAITACSAGPHDSGSHDADTHGDVDVIIDADRRVLMPGFVDAHTHACWAGDRLDEWAARLRGAEYLELLEGGGGIMSTVRAVRATPESDLASGLEARLWSMASTGTTTAEVKSGYGLTTDDELKMLRAIALACRRLPMTVVPTACIGHAIEGDHSAFVDRTVRETLPAVTDAYPGIAIDAYCERNAWDVRDTVRLFEVAAAAGHTLRVHTDQFTDMGMVGEAVRLGTASCDHLEASSTETLRLLAASSTYGVMLPCSGFHLDERFGDGRAFIDAGGRLAIGTNLNPGSAPCSSMPMAIALACRCCGLSPGEAIVASTRTPADLLGLADLGRIAVGCRADVVLLSHRDERELAHTFGGNPCDLVLAGGWPVFDPRDVFGPVPREQPA
ncbi:MAG: imidazolonepropionase [Planctomycetota bacterium]